MHGIAAGAGALAGPWLLGTADAMLAVRSAALTLALTLVGAALVRLLRLGTAEWRREAPRPQEYLLTIGRFLVAFMLVVVATA